MTDSVGNDGKIIWDRKLLSESIQPSKGVHDFEDSERLYESSKCSKSSSDVDVHQQA